MDSAPAALGRSEIRPRSGGSGGAPPDGESVHPTVVEAGRRLDPLLGARDVLLLELLEMGDPSHHVVALGRMPDLRLLEESLRLLLVALKILHRVPHRVPRLGG